MDCAAQKSVASAEPSLDVEVRASYNLYFGALQMCNLPCWRGSNLHAVASNSGTTATMQGMTFGCLRCKGLS
jgi:hypothetical protein